MTSNFAAKRGFSLIEMAIVLGVLGIVLAGLWGLVSVAREHIKREDAFEQISIVVQNTRDFFKGRARVATPAGARTAAALTSYLIEQNVLLPEQIRDRSVGTGNFVADHPWGSAGASGAALPNGGLLISSDAVDHSGAYQVELRGLKLGSCVALVSRFSGASAPAGLLKIKINANAERDPPVTAEIAGTECVAPTGQGNTILLTYRLRQ